MYFINFTFKRSHTKCHWSLLSIDLGQSVVRPARLGTLSANSQLNKQKNGNTDSRISESSRGPGREARGCAIEMAQSRFSPDTGDLELTSLDGLDDVDDLLIRRKRRPPQTASSRLCLRLCSKPCLRVTAFSLMFLVLGILIGHVSLRIVTTDSSLYTRAAAPGADYTTRFMVVGDWGRGGEYHQSDVALQMGLVGEVFRPHFVLSTGDNFYPSGLKHLNDSQVDKSFTQVYNYPSLQVPWYSVLGNHDYGDGSGKHDFTTNPTLQSTEVMAAQDDRWVCCGGRDFVSKRPEETEDDGSLAELFFVDTSPFVHKYYKESWAANSGGILDEKEKTKDKTGALDVALERSVSPWKIVVGHHPIRSNGRHGDTPELLSVLPEILNRNKADFYFNVSPFNEREREWGWKGLSFVLPVFWLTHSPPFSSHKTGLQGHDHDLQLIADPSNPGLRYVTSGAGSRTRLESFYGDNKVAFHTFSSGFVTVALSSQQARVQFWLWDSTLAHELVAQK